MVVFSLLRPNGPAGKYAISMFNRSRSVLATIPKQGAAPIRSMSGKPVFNVKASTWTWQQFKNDLHFFVGLGVIPLGLLILYANIFVGPAQLTEIPEDYEPYHWEYFKSPITRWFAHHIYESPEEKYERLVSYVCREQEKIKLRKQEQRMKQLMYARGDYVGWFYIPFTDEYHKRARTRLESYRNQTKIQ
ncbi:PREDICTED: NADH dehydrogenase [ubiquinone] 1 beta subcomplex subunit 5, mitochondrial-like [Priapulus caudatus]|uniref:NADH dehydrogenase [ubiquinone] 1 beta subcomplex subunit 5, mitochondrial n=1 Tax=Priapulus caudatus TaxID=37621 RepID=A0ABM1EK56_PRICU|nr:PREDICTED: NADH dehydrogenase [ubiquinone] 1 beta subcomplex subunit 5, mitochondrial-like [Priapulus caudatus]